MGTGNQTRIKIEIITKTAITIAMTDVQTIIINQELKQTRAAMVIDPITIKTLAIETEINAGMSLQ